MAKKKRRDPSAANLFLDLVDELVRQHPELLDLPENERKARCCEMLADMIETNAQETPQTRSAAPDPNRPRSQPRPPGD